MSAWHWDNPVPRIFGRSGHLTHTIKDGTEDLGQKSLLRQSVEEKTAPALQPFALWLLFIKIPPYRHTGITNVRGVAKASLKSW